MTDTKTNEDLREKILSECDKEYVSGYGFIPTKEALLNALDEYWEKRAKELLEWMAENKIECSDMENGPLDKDKHFWYKKQWITKDELFQNFL